MRDTICLGGTIYEFVSGSAESLGGRNSLDIYPGDTTKLTAIAILQRVPTVGPVEFDEPEMIHKKRTPYSYLIEIIEKSLETGNLPTALAATIQLSNFPDV